MTRFALVMVLVACSKSPAPAPAPAPAFHLTFGDATIYTLVDRRYTKLDKPTRDLVLHADGAIDIINDKNDQVFVTLAVKPNGEITAQDKLEGTITEHAVTSSAGKQTVAIDGNTVSLDVNGKTQKVTLAADGTITVVDSAYGAKWRVDAPSADVRYTAFLVLAATWMKVALD